MIKYALLSVFVVIFGVGLAVIFSNESVSLTEAFGSLSKLSPRVLSLLTLPVIAVLFVLGIYLKRKREDRLWKSALLETRKKKQR